jgi:hypothetical protein
MTQRQGEQRQTSIHLDNWIAWIKSPSLETQRRYATTMAKTCAYSGPLTEYAQWLLSLDHIVTVKDIRARAWPFGGFCVAIPGADGMAHIA